jgi:hypothetical protein
MPTDKDGKWISLETWTDEIYELLDKGCSLGDIEDAARITIECIREERGDDE